MQSDVDADVDGQLLPPLAGKRVQFFRLLHGKHVGDEVIVEQQVIVVIKGIAEDQDGLLDAGLAQLHAFFGNGHAEIGGTRFLKDLGAGGSAVTVGVSLDGRHQLGSGGKAAHNECRVLPQGIQVDFNPGRSHVINLFFVIRPRPGI